MQSGPPIGGPAARAVALPPSPEWADSEADIRPRIIIGVIGIAVGVRPIAAIVAVIARPIAAHVNAAAHAALRAEFFTDDLLVDSRLLLLRRCRTRHGKRRQHHRCRNSS